MLKVKSPEAVAWLVTSSVTGLGLLCAAAFIYEKTRRRLEHPTLGKLTYQGKSWSGLKANIHPDQPAIRFELPGDKVGPDPEECEKLNRFWTDLPSTISRIRPEAIEELREIRDAYEDEPEGELISTIFGNLAKEESSFEQHWSLCEILKLRETDSKVVWTLEFEVAWDIEHSRAAYLNSAGEVLAYNLSCAGSGIEDH